MYYSYSTALRLQRELHKWSDTHICVNSIVLQYLLWWLFHTFNFSYKFFVRYCMLLLAYNIAIAALVGFDMFNETIIVLYCVVFNVHLKLQILSISVYFQLIILLSRICKASYLDQELRLLRLWSALRLELKISTGDDRHRHSVNGSWRLDNCNHLTLLSPFLLRRGLKDKAQRASLACKPENIRNTHFRCY